MKILYSQSVNSRPTFGTSLKFFDTTSVFNCEQREQLKKHFEEDTQKTAGELIVSRADSLVTPPYYRFVYKNGSHVDKLSCYIAKMPNSVSGFVDKLEQIFDIFTKRERNLTEIRQLNDTFHKNSFDSFSRVADMKILDLTKVDFKD